MSAPDAEIRAAERVLAGAVRDPVTGCWEITRARLSKGYGQVGAGGRNRLAHRLVMTVLSGVAYTNAPAPVTRHLCGNPPCVNPLHLRFGTQVQNIRDSIEAGTHAAELRARTHCPRGHALAGVNLVPSKLARGRRECVVCHRARALRDRAKRRRGQDISLEYFIASELSRTDGGRDLVARDALGKTLLEPLVPPARDV